MAEAAQALGFEIMVGCMVATSLAMAPATLIAQRARFVDLDGPLLLAADRDDGLRYDGSTVILSAGRAALCGNRFVHARKAYPARWPRATSPSEPASALRRQLA